ncbi:MAG: GIY-YIG nuclease family protein [Candidatus Saganbacteria bacterium]|nr:GIY-YIG nuclease family protein [Candidatus Saganbacteria bacterium]
MFYLYVLKNSKNDKYYIGSTRDLEGRLKAHNSGKVRSTKGLAPLEIAYAESYATNAEARKREIYLKKRKSRKYIDALIGLRKNASKKPVFIRLSNIS